MRIPTLILAASGLLAAGSAVAENSIAYQAYKYGENADRIDVTGSNLTIDTDYGTDFASNIGLGYDTVSGATPMWVDKPGYVNEWDKGLQKVATETRNYLTASGLMRDTARNEYSAGVTYSKEPDYLSRGLNASVQLWHDDSKNRSYTLGGRVLFNSALASSYTNHRQDEDSTAVNLQAGVNQVIDASTTLEASLYYNRERGYLNNQYLKVVRINDSGVKQLLPDTRPDSREGGGFALRAIKSWRDDLVTNLWYRFYRDDWGITGHSAELRVSYDLTPKWRVSPLLRLHRQSAANFQRDYHAASNMFALSGNAANDARLGKLTALTRQLTVEYQASKEWSLNAAATHYRQDNGGLNARWLTAGFTLKY